MDNALLGLKTNKYYGPNDRQPRILPQVFVALIRNSPRLSGAPQPVQRLLD
jgi:hypothetical protein